MSAAFVLGWNSLDNVLIMASRGSEIKRGDRQNLHVDASLWMTRRPDLPRPAPPREPDDTRMISGTSGQHLVTSRSLRSNTHNVACSPGSD